MTGYNNLKQGLRLGAVFFDFEKAFDRVPHQLLMSKLMGLGLDPYIMTWLHNYLPSRRQSIVVTGTTSESSHAISGVPQGSILGPLLFLIYIDDITMVHSLLALVSFCMQTIFFCTASFSQSQTIHTCNQMPIQYRTGQITTTCFSTLSNVNSC